MSWFQSLVNKVVTAFGKVGASIPVKTPSDSSTPTPWIDWMNARIGWNENDNDKQLSEYWKYTTYSAKTVRGSQFAWCAMTVNAALFETGFTGNRSPSAASFATYGLPWSYMFGAILPIRHADGAHHVTFFVGWEDEEKKLAKCLGGNQSNALRVSVYNLSGNKDGHDEVVPGPRWPVKV